MKWVRCCPYCPSPTPLGPVYFYLTSFFLCILGVDTSNLANGSKDNQAFKSSVATDLNKA